ncbi:hypothetical protein MVLG_07140 [Microbotryum lychnidis-dioicae p1A1 Lamole]|uniref:Uncharacterized protein n=1 Tax=Microbotryum lychnidis-dioicae (strain p1A1 Lamole / MvSl-1064) TaxID=683840 RepID=U5HJF8_USTV1|nr:hypothetical protein MVLG_07140 [Microbotryum lychnidis-dioicae p1A1 Lamole]|eukprot:KDE02295.1 hypothetical protein MVLG_07140 [Microbotryum lychnidis-dioicae p1A1 Lamole]
MTSNPLFDTSMSYKATRPLVAPPDPKSIQTTLVPAAKIPDWLARQRATINWQRHMIAGPSNQLSNPALVSKVKIAE